MSEQPDVEEFAALVDEERQPVKDMALQVVAEQVRDVGGSPMVVDMDGNVRAGPEDVEAVRVDERGGVLADVGGDEQVMLGFVERDGERTDGAWPEHVVDDMDVVAREFADAKGDGSTIVSESQAAAMFLRDVVGLKRAAAAEQMGVGASTVDRNRLRGRRNLHAAARTLQVAENYDLLDEYDVTDVLRPVCSSIHDASAAQTPLHAFAKQVSKGVRPDDVRTVEHAGGIDVVVQDDDGVEHTITTVDTSGNGDGVSAPAGASDDDVGLWQGLAALDGLRDLQRRDGGDGGTVVIPDEADVINRAQQIVKASGFYVRGQMAAGGDLHRIMFRREGTDAPQDEQDAVGEGQDTSTGGKPDSTESEASDETAHADVQGLTYECGDCGNVTEDANMPMTNCVECGGDLETVDDEPEHSDEWQAFVDTYETDEHTGPADVARDGIDRALHYNTMRSVVSTLSIGAGTSERPTKDVVLDRLVDAGVFVDPFSEDAVVETADGVVPVEDVDDLQDVTTPSANIDRLSQTLSDAMMAADGGETDE